MIDPDRITVIDFKTGEEETLYYRTQLINYMKILRALNPQKTIKGYLAYIDARKVEEVK
ncbi:PD-(D/E)XK nuclease family protein [candidate division WOR-3 bacterium]|nr:PD-(D/E)XK nuclease family protein [candidate division WOR-3 bacterium]